LRVLRGSVVIVALTLLGLAIARWRGALYTSLAALGEVRPAFLALGALQALLDQFLGGGRIWATARALGAPARLGTCVVANCANVFLGGVTPSQSGGGPAQVYVLVRGGLGLTEAAVASAIAFLGTSVVFLALALALQAPAELLGGKLRVVAGASAALFAAVLVVCFFAMRRPEFRNGTLRRRLGRLPLVGASLERSRRLRELELLAEQASSRVRRALRHGKALLLLGLLLSVLIYLNKFLVAWVVLQGLGVPGAIGAVLRIQQLQYLVTYFAPTPGASGLAEISAAELMRRLVPADRMGAYLLLWRTFSLYLGMAVGGAVLVRTGLVGAARVRRWRRPKGA
jgi:hypothetical protein